MHFLHLSGKNRNQCISCRNPCKKFFSGHRNFATHETPLKHIPRHDAQGDVLRGPNFKNRRSMKQTGLFLFTALAVLCAACRYAVCLMTVLSVTAFASCSGDITESDGTTEQPENPGTPEDPDNPDGQDGRRMCHACGTRWPLRTISQSRWQPLHRVWPTISETVSCISRLRLQPGRARNAGHRYPCIGRPCRPGAGMSGSGLCRNYEILRI